MKSLPCIIIHFKKGKKKQKKGKKPQELLLETPVFDEQLYQNCGKREKKEKKKKGEKKEENI